MASQLVLSLFPDVGILDRGAVRPTLGGPRPKYFMETRRLQGLPEDYDLPGFKIEEKVRALGNAVPYPMARAMARSVKAALAIGEGTP